MNRQPEIHPRIDDVDIARMEEYALLAALLRRAPDSALLEALSGIRGDSTQLGAAHTALARAAEEADCELLEREFFELFIGVGRGELLPYGSYYLTGFLNERPLARLRDDLRMLGIVRAEQQNEPEDHAAILCEIMAGLAGGGLAAAPDAQKRLFEKHLAPWIGRFFADLEGLKRANFYRHVATSWTSVHRHRNGSVRPALLYEQRRKPGGNEMRSNHKLTLGRRDFLRALGAGAAVTAAAPLAIEAKADSETNDEKRKSRYKETDHVKAYYRVNRYPS